MSKDKMIEVFDRTEEILKLYGLQLKVDYGFHSQQSGTFGNEMTEDYFVTFPYDKNVSDELTKYGWIIQRKYYNHGSPSFYCSDIHNDKTGLYDLINHHGRKVQMVRMIYAFEKY